MKGIHSFQGKSSLKSWVYSIAINKVKDFQKYQLRKKRRGQVISLHQEETVEIISYRHPENILESKEKIALIHRAIFQLPENQRQALLLKKFEDCSVNEIASIMGLSYKAVESLLSRAKKNLKSALLNIGLKNIKK